MDFETVDETRDIRKSIITLLKRRLTASRGREILKEKNNRVTLHMSLADNLDCEIKVSDDDLLEIDIRCTLMNVHSHVTIEVDELD